MIYFDNNATTRIAPEVLEAMMPFMTDSFGNPSSAHLAGREPKAAVERARESVAELLGAASPAEIAFTSCGTESDNWAILGSLALQPEKKHIVTTRVEHEAVRKLCERLASRGYEVTWLEVDENGLLDLDQLPSVMRPDTAVVSVMLANNETGILFPVVEIAELVKQNSSALFHVDGVNAAGKVPISLRDTRIDIFSISGHKFNGPKGVGALYIRDGVILEPFMIGGGQESSRRAGTEAVHQVVGIGAAARFVADMSAMERVRRMLDRLERTILSEIPDSCVNGTTDTGHRLPNTSSISFKNTNGEAILARLNDLGICVSTGSACNSESHTASPVLEAMNIPYSTAMGAIRFSLGRFNTEDEVDTVLTILPGIIADLRAMA
jgi:cysteine desulfurase